MIDVSIVIVSYNARADLERCLTSLHTPPSPSHQIIVVDNASTDGSAQAAAQWPAVRVIQVPTNLGFAAATNLGIQGSSGRLLLLLNSDTIVPAGAVDRLVAELEKHPEAAAIGPRLVDGNGRAELSFGAMLTPFSELLRQRLMRQIEQGDARALARVEATTRRPQAPDWISGACLLVWRADAEAVGLLDERYFMYAEDVDFCAALRARGRRVRFTPSVEIVHLRGRSVATAPEATRAAYLRSHLAFYQKHHPLVAPLLSLYRRLRPL